MTFHRGWPTHTYTNVPARLPAHTALLRIFFTTTCHALFSAYATTAYKHSGPSVGCRIPTSPRHAPAPAAAEDAPPALPAAWIPGKRIMPVCHAA